MTNGTRSRWGVSVTPWPLFTPGKDPVPIVQEAGWTPGPVWTGAENLAPPPPGFDPRTVQPVVSRYTDWAIAALFAPPWQGFYCSFTMLTAIYARQMLLLSHGNSGFTNAPKCYVGGKLRTLLKLLILYRNPNFIRAIADTAFYIGTGFSFINLLAPEFYI